MNIRFFNKAVAICLLGILFTNCGNDSGKKLPLLPKENTLTATLVYDNHNSFTFPTDKSVTLLNPKIQTNLNHYECNSPNLPTFLALDNDTCKIQIDQSKITQATYDQTTSYRVNVVNEESNEIIAYDDLSITILKKSDPVPPVPPVPPTPPGPGKKTILSYADVKNNTFIFNDGEKSVYFANDAMQDDVSVGPFFSCTSTPELPSNSPIQFAKNGQSCDLVYNGLYSKLKSDDDIGMMKIVGSLVQNGKTIFSEPVIMDVIIKAKGNIPPVPPTEVPTLSYDDYSVQVGQVPTTPFNANINPKDPFVSCSASGTKPSFVTINSNCTYIVKQDISNNDASANPYIFNVTGFDANGKSATANAKLTVIAKEAPPPPPHQLTTITYSSISASYDPSGTSITSSPSFSAAGYYSCSTKLVSPNLPSYVFIQDDCTVKVNKSDIKSSAGDSVTKYIIYTDNKNAKGTIDITIKSTPLVTMSFGSNIGKENTYDVSQLALTDQKVFSPTFTNSQYIDTNNLNCNIEFEPKGFDQHINENNPATCSIKLTPRDIQNIYDQSGNLIDTENIIFTLTDKLNRTVKTTLVLKNITK